MIQAIDGRIANCPGAEVNIIRNIEPIRIQVVRIVIRTVNIVPPVIFRWNHFGAVSIVDAIIDKIHRGDYEAVEMFNVFPKSC